MNIKNNFTFKSELGKEYSVKTERVISLINKEGMITRGSSYGAEILCTFTMPIIDIDFKNISKPYSEMKVVRRRCLVLAKRQLEYYDEKININLYRTKKAYVSSFRDSMIGILTRPSTLWRNSVPILSI